MAYKPPERQRLQFCRITGEKWDDDAAALHVTGSFGMHVHKIIIFTLISHIRRHGGMSCFEQHKNGRIHTDSTIYLPDLCTCTDEYEEHLHRTSIF